MFKLSLTHFEATMYLALAISVILATVANGTPR